MQYDCDMDSLVPLQQTLRASGQSLTAPRRAVFAAMQHQEPLTMSELVRRCTDIDRASVYRTVALFEQLGIVQRLQTGWKYRLELSDVYHEHHHHATCLSCGRSLIVPEDETIEQYLMATAQKLNFRLERHQVELQGYCGQCSAHKSTP